MTDLTRANAPVAQCATDFTRDAWAYWIDACQRGVLFLDVLQQRSERYHEHAAKAAPHVLKFGCELVMDGRKLPRPVNYVLVRIVPPERHRDRRKQASIRHRRSARRARPRHWRLQAAERDRRRPQGRASLLLHRVPARARARADDRGHRARRGRVSRARDRAPSGSRGQARGDRQLPGRLGGHAARGHEARAVRPDHRRRLAAVLLGRRAWRRTPCATPAGCSAAAGSPR